MVELSLDGIGDALDKGLSMAEPFLFGLGVVYGSTEDVAANNHYQSLSSDFATQFEWRLSDSIAHITGQQIAINGKQSGQTFKFNPLGFLNKGLVAAIASWAYKESKLPYSKEIYKGVFPFGTGYSLGGLFDPAGSTGLGIGSPSGLVGAGFNYSPSYSGSPTQGGIALGNVPFVRAEAGTGRSLSVVT